MLDRYETTLAIADETVPALILTPPAPRFAYVLAHGAGAGMRHSFLERIAVALADRDIATFRFMFPFMAAERRRPDSPAVSEAAIRAAVAAATVAFPGLRLVAGGKSFGGRMTSNAAARGDLQNVRGLAFLGFPLHAPKRPSSTRAEHLGAVRLPMLFLQGTRDDLADLDLMRGVSAQLGARATLHVVEGANHGFEVLKRSGRTHDEVLAELADRIATWGNGV